MWKALLWLLGLIVAAYLATVLGPWAYALVIRQALDEGAELQEQQLSEFAPRVREVRDEQYDPTDSDAFLDVFHPLGVENPALPTIVWVHGGGWISGDKDFAASYLKFWASHGFTAVGVNFSLAPARKYPEPVRQVNRALAYLKENSERLQVDPSKFFLAGESSGAQIAAQLANVISVPSYAKEMGIVPSITRQQLRGIVLYSGIHDPDDLSVEDALGGYFRLMIKSYFGAKDYRNDPRFAQFSVVRHLTAEFPPMFISTSDVDPLARQSHKLAEVAASFGVPVYSVFYPKDHDPQVRIQYPFALNTDAGMLAFQDALIFASNISKH